MALSKVYTATALITFGFVETIGDFTWFNNIKKDSSIDLDYSLKDTTSILQITNCNFSDNVFSSSVVVTD